MVDLAREVGANAVAHGCTGKGNDQERFELLFNALNPKLKVVVPWREWDIKGREDAIEYASKHDIPVPVSKKSIYSRDRNLWYISHEGDILEDQPDEGMCMMTPDPIKAPYRPKYVEIAIEKGVPVSINGKSLSPANLLVKLNEIGSNQGIGRVDMVENRLVGMKSRGGYEILGGTIMFQAVRALEAVTLDRETMQWKQMEALKYAELVSAGRWFGPLRKAMDAFMEDLLEKTSGVVKLQLDKECIKVVSRSTPYSLNGMFVPPFKNYKLYYRLNLRRLIMLCWSPSTHVGAMHNLHFRVGKFVSQSSF